MSMAYKCDACGKLFEGEGEYEVLIERYRGCKLKIFKGEICPDCYKKVMIALCKEEVIKDQEERDKR